MFLIFSFVSGADYKFDRDGDGVIDRVENDVGDLAWVISFVTYGSKETGTNKPPTLSLNEEPILTIAFDESQSPIPNAFWGMINYRDVYNGEIVEKTYYTFERYPSSMNTTDMQDVILGEYNFSMVSYGGGLNPSLVGWPSWEGLTCSEMPICCDPDGAGCPTSGSNCPPGWEEYFENQVSVCNNSLYANKCPVCNDNPNSCSETSEQNAYLCNGVHAEIDFYDSTKNPPDNYLFTIKSDDWGDEDVGDIIYFKDKNWWTDSNPGIVDINQTIVICEDECSVGEKGCNTSSQKWECIMGAGGCYVKNYTNCFNGEVCENGGCVPMADAYWADMNDEEINSSQVNDRAKMIYPISGVQIGTGFMFEIYEKDSISSDDKIKTQEQGNAIYIDYSGEKLESSWKINNSDIEEAGNEDVSNFYFKVFRNVSGSWVEVSSSEILKVGNEENNSPPNASIESPVVGEVYFVNEDIWFNQTSEDEDDFINYTWYLDGETKSGSTEDYNNYNLTHSYSGTGQKQIKLVVEDGRRLTDVARTSILIIDLSEDKKYIFAHIDNPEWGESVVGTNISFNAGSTFAINTSDNNLYCLGGSCPSKANSGDSINGNGMDDDYSDIEFSWKFDDGEGYSKKGDDGKAFIKYFPNLGSHWADLTAKINPSSSVRSDFKIEDKIMKDEIKFKEEDNKFIIIIITLIILGFLGWKLFKKK